MINAEECLNNKFATSLQGQSSRSEIPIIIATDAERYFYDKFTSDIPNNMQRYVDDIYCFFCCREPSYYRFVQIKFCITFFCSKHIFQVDDVWIDKRTLALSMRSGCWFNSFAMSAFCKMFNHEQKERLKLRQRNLDELTYFYMNKKIVVCLLHFVHFFTIIVSIYGLILFFTFHMDRIC